MGGTAGDGSWGGGAFRECLARARNSNTRSDPYYHIEQMLKNPNDSKAPLKATSEAASLPL